MIQIRKGTFETNSSSTHSMVIGLDSDFEKWANGELFFIGDCYCLRKQDKNFVTKEELIDLIKAKQEELKAKNASYTYFKGFKGTFDEADLGILRDEKVFVTLDQYCECKDEYFESDESSYTTPSGEKVRVLAYYGYDG